jgi:hypothetical protein
MWKDLMGQLAERRLSFAIVYTIFVLVGLIAAVVLFGVLHSTGAVQLVLEGYVKQAEFGGAFAGFLALLIFLVRSYNAKVDQGAYHITGVVYYKDELPAEGATVIVEGSGNSGRSSAVGHFDIEVREQRKWVVAAHLGNAKAPAATVLQRDVGTPVRLKLDKTKAQLRTDEMPQPKLVRHKVS